MPQDFEASSYLRLSIQHSMVGNVTSNLAALHSRFENNMIHIVAYFFQEPSDQDREYFSRISTLVIADFPWEAKLKEFLYLISEAPTKGIPWNYLRAEAEMILQSTNPKH
jgi:hypothetical protein